MRISLSNDLGSQVRKHASKMLADAGIPKLDDATGSRWEGARLPPEVMAAVADVLRVLSNLPDSVPGCNPAIRVERVAMSIEADPN